MIDFGEQRLRARMHPGKRDERRILGRMQSEQDVHLNLQTRERIRLQIFFQAQLLS